MLRIHEYRGFPNPTRIRIALAEKGLLDNTEFINVNVLAGENRRSEFLARNPTGTVPVLELEDGTHISECTAITEYLDHLTGEPTLTGQGARERAMIHMMHRRAEANLLDAVATYYHHATPGFGPELETYQNREWGEKSRDKAVATMHYLDEVLANQPYVAGERFTMADITVLAGLAYADYAKIDVPAGLTNLRNWRARTIRRPSVANA
ncbi:MAG TPA: glutathione S-transferase [Burkholderiaceae bacterium]|nr:glutathione S-transferase [Burkholderiaceae bacterium]